MRLGSTVAVAVVAAALVACGPRTPQCSVLGTLGFGGSGGTAATALAALVGSSTTVPLVDENVLVCDGVAQAPTAARTTVEDGQGQEVLHTASRPTGDLDRGSAVFVTFSPLTPGQHLVTATFEPALGVARRTLTAVEQRGWAGAARYATGGDCQRVERVGPGVLCLTAQGWRYASADAGQDLAPPTCRSARADDAVWLACPGTVTQYRLDAGVLVAAATGPSAFAGAVVGAAARSGSFVVGHTRVLQEYGVDGGVVVPLRSRAADVLTPLTAEPALVPVADDGWLVTAGTATTATYLPWQGSQRTVSLSGKPLVATDGALWLLDPSSGSLTRLHYAFTVDLPTRSFAPELPAALNGATRAPLPLVSLFNQTLVIDGTRLVWVAFVEPPSGSDARLAWRAVGTELQVVPLAP